MFSTGTIMVQYPTTYLSEIASSEHQTFLLEGVNNQGPITLHACREGDQVEPLSTDIQEYIDMRPLVYREPNIVPIQGYLFQQS